MLPPPTPHPRQGTSLPASRLLAPRASLPSARRRPAPQPAFPLAELGSPWQQGLLCLLSPVLPQDEGLVASWLAGK